MIEADRLIAADSPIFRDEEMIDLVTIYHLTNHTMH